MLLYILVVLILFVIFIWLVMKVFATEETEIGNMVGGEKCIRVSMGDICKVEKNESRLV